MAGWLTFTLATTACTLFAVCCCLYIAPAAAGSGIPDVMAYLNGVDVPAVLSFRTLVAKILGSLGSVGGGLAVGKEGPFVHIGACIASVFSQVRALAVARRYSQSRTTAWLVRIEVLMRTRACRVDSIACSRTREGSEQLTRAVFAIAAKRVRCVRHYASRLAAQPT